MTERKTLRTKTYVLLALMVIFGSSGDVLLSRGMKKLGGLDAWSFHGVLHFFINAFTNGSVWLGIAMLLLFFISYLLVLSWADFSYVSPASAVGYVLVAVMGYFFLGEYVPPVRWLGVALICVGVFLVGGTHPNTRQSG
ncbi:MAG: EamA family transporter [Acidobacteria bacterium]|nr:EamA family transporter [Acidobacteriota bacterium]